MSPFPSSMTSSTRDRRRHRPVAARYALPFRFGSDASGKTGHAMLFNSDGAPLICPILSPEEHNVTSELVDAINASPCRMDDGDRTIRMAGKNSVIVDLRRFAWEHLLPGEFGGKAMGDFRPAGPGGVLCAALRGSLWQVTLYGLCGIRRRSGRPALPSPAGLHVRSACCTKGCSESGAVAWIIG